MSITDLLGTCAFGLSVYNFAFARWEKRPKATVEMFTAFGESRSSASSLERVMRMYSLAEVERTGVQNLLPVIVLTIINTGDKPLSLMRRGTILPNKRVIYVDEQPSTTLVGMDPMPLDLHEDKKGTTLIPRETLEAILQEYNYTGSVRLTGFYEDVRGKRFTSRAFIYEMDRAETPKPIESVAR